jgi:hypothetical protein
MILGIAPDDKSRSEVVEDAISAYETLRRHVDDRNRE